MEKCYSSSSNTSNDSPSCELLITMFKETPLLAAITVVELFRAADQYSNSHYTYLEPMTLVGIFFLIVSIPICYASYET